MPAVAGNKTITKYIFLLLNLLCIFHSFLGHVLFPGSTRSFDTTTGSNFIPFQNVAQTKPIVRLDANGNLKTSGN